MKIEHVALWTNDLERMKNFYIEFFKGKSNEKYTNPNTGFSSYFISFDNDSRLEIMSNINNQVNQDAVLSNIGYAHIAISVGSKEIVDILTNRISDKGYIVISQPRTTGDGYYESIILDPDGNRIEITI